MSKTLTIIICSLIIVGCIVILQVRSRSKKKKAEQHIAKDETKKLD